jgi:hypothetical protein
VILKFERKTYHLRTSLRSSAESWLRKIAIARRMGWGGQESVT